MILSQFRRAALAVGAVAAAIGVASAGGAMAATTTAQFEVVAGVQTTCLIAANPVSFGSYTGGATSATGLLVVNCSNTTPYNIGLDAGTGAAATVTSRKMTGPGGAALTYSLFQDPAHSTNWGNTVGTDTVPGTGNGANQDFTVYGLLPAAQNVAPGTYLDTVTATLTF
jgi:spore coat protein U-like protein